MPGPGSCRHLCHLRRRCRHRQRYCCCSPSPSRSREHGTAAGPQGFESATPKLAAPFYRRSSPCGSGNFFSPMTPASPRRPPPAKSCPCEPRSPPATACVPRYSNSAPFFLPSSTGPPRSFPSASSPFFAAATSLPAAGVIFSCRERHLQYHHHQRQRPQQWDRPATGSPAPSHRCNGGLAVAFQRGTRLPPVLPLNAPSLSRAFSSQLGSRKRRSSLAWAATLSQKISK